jgi:hypothetical protein
VHAGKALRETVGFGIDDEVHVALAKQRDVLGAVLGYLDEAHALEQRTQGSWIGRRIFDELETVGAHWIDRVGFKRLGVADARHGDLQN